MLKEEGIERHDLTGIIHFFGELLEDDSYDIMWRMAVIVVLYLHPAANFLFPANTKEINKFHKMTADRIGRLGELSRNKIDFTGYIDFWDPAQFAKAQRADKQWLKTLCLRVKKEMHNN